MTGHDITMMQKQSGWWYLQCTCSWKADPARSPFYAEFQGRRHVRRATAAPLANCFFHEIEDGDDPDFAPLEESFLRWYNAANPHAPAQTAGEAWVETYGRKRSVQTDAERRGKYPRPGSAS